MDFKSILKRRWPEALLLAVAAVLRLVLLGMKPPHFDEGVNGWFVDQMTKSGFYHYDPSNYHGPFHFYVLFLAQTLLGRHIWALRLPMALMGVASVWLTLKFERFLGRPAVLWAAAAMAVSPGCVFYSRYAIHEYWMVFSLMLFAWGAAGLWQYGEKKYLWACWIGLTGAVLTKETYVIHFGCFLLTLPCVWLLGKISPAAPVPAPQPAPPAPRAKRKRPAAKRRLLLSAAIQQWSWWDMALGALLFAGCVLFFYSGGLLDPSSLKGLYQTFAAWFKTDREGNGHEKVWYYWFKLYARYEWPASLGLLAALASVAPGRTRFLRALSIYGLGALAAYCIIPYKTPWCIVSLTWPFLLLFGSALADCARFFPRTVKIAAGILLAGSLGYSVWLNGFHCTDAAQPYVYVQTFDDVNKVVDPIYLMAARDPANYELLGHIVMDSYHPLPWLLGDFPQVGYYGDDLTPDAMDADFLLVEQTRIDEVEAKLQDQYFTEDVTLRDSEDPSKLYLSVKKFRAIYPGRRPDFIPPSSVKIAPSPSPSPAP